MEVLNEGRMHNKAGADQPIDATGPFLTILFPLYHPLQVLSVLLHNEQDSYLRSWQRKWREKKKTDCTNISTS
jgi:hypothetical protein